MFNQTLSSTVLIFEVFPSSISQLFLLYMVESPQFKLAYTAKGS